MKYALKLILASLLLTISSISMSDAYIAGCTKCETSDDECHRVISGNEVHIFYGKEKSCEDEQ